MPLLKKLIPGYRHHKASGPAIVTLSSRDHYLGPYGSDESRAAYDRLVAEWLSGGRYLVPAETTTSIVTINEVILCFWKYVEWYYRRPDGSASGPTSDC